MFALSPIFSALDYRHGHVYSINAKPFGTLDQMIITLKADGPHPGGNLHTQAVVSLLLKKWENINFQLSEWLSMISMMQKIMFVLRLHHV